MMSSQLDRHLAAVLAFDIVGYSRLMGADEQGTLERVLTRRKTLIDPAVAEYRGRVVKGTGDGILATFGSAQDAIRAALRIQDGMAEANAIEPSDPPMTARIGITIGDILFDADGDIFGDGVNIAARLEAMAPPGGICVSARALDDLKRVGAPFTDLGKLVLKNIAEPVHAYCIPADTVATAPAPAIREPTATWRRSYLFVAAAAGSLLLVMAAGAWWLLKPAAAAAHSMTVRLAGFKTLSTDLPATLRETVDAEIAAAFNADGVVGVSTASAPVPGTAPAYALGGTIRRDGPRIRVITRLTNERSGETLWTDNFNYDGNEVSRVPRHIAVDAGNVVRCGLFGASTYYKPLPDAVLRDYMQFCQGHWDPNLGEGRKALVPAQRVVAAVPDFSWGWAAVAGAMWKIALSADTNQAAEEARAAGRQAADRAVAIDGKNSEALYIKSMLVDRNDWIGREKLLKQAIAVRRLDCGCEYHQYGALLANVGRNADAVQQLHRADDMLALYVYTPLTLADALVAAGKPNEAKQYFDAAIDLAPNAVFAKHLAIRKATLTGDVGPLLDPKSPASAELPPALLDGYRAMASRDAGAKAQSIRALLALPENRQSAAVAMLLADLGSTHEAFRIAARLATTAYAEPSIFWYPRMRGTLRDPGFPAVAAQLGLMQYWKTMHVKPDVCSRLSPPDFCRMI